MIRASSMWYNSETMSGGFQGAREQFNVTIRRRFKPQTLKHRMCVLLSKFIFERMTIMR